MSILVELGSRKERCHMTRIVIAAFALGIWAGFMLALDPIALDIVPYYTQVDRSDLTELILTLEQ